MRMAGGYLRVSAVSVTGKRTKGKITVMVKLETQAKLSLYVL